MLIYLGVRHFILKYDLVYSVYFEIRSSLLDFILKYGLLNNLLDLILKYGLV